MDALVCQTRDEITGELVSFPVVDWLRMGIFSDTTLVLIGQSGVGKTSLAQTLCQALADRLQDGAGLNLNTSHDFLVSRVH